MGRLFWKIFAVILLAQVTATFVVGVLIWQHKPPPEAFAQHPFPSERGSAPFAGQPFESRPPEFAPDGNRDDPRRGPPPHPIPWLPLWVGGVASLIFAVLLAHHLSRPIMALRRAFDAVARGNFDVHPSQGLGKRHDELAELSVEFEHTAAQIKALVGSQRRLLHDVSHELRSPLARLQLAIDLAQQQPERTAECMARIERERGRLDLLIGELLTLSRLEAGAGVSVDEIVELQPLLETLVEDARFEASTSSRRIDFQPSGAPSVRGNAEMLGRAFENVLRNALGHTPDHACVRVAVSAENGQARVRIEDEGPGLPESALDAVFEPFTRLNTGPEREGYGLGLAIARQTLLACGGSICARNRDTGGLVVEMSLPLAPPGAQA